MFADPISAAIVLAIGVAIGAAVGFAVRFRPAVSDPNARAAGGELPHRAGDAPAQVGVRADELQDLNARLLSIINSAVDGIVVIDGRGQVESFNPGAERLFGYVQAEVVGRNVSVLMPSLNRARETANRGGRWGDIGRALGLRPDAARSAYERARQ